MADTVTSRIVSNSARSLAMRFTNFSDATGESGVVKVDATNVANGYQGVAPGVNLKLQYINWAVTGTAVLRIRWQATADEDAFVCSYDGQIDFAPYGCIKCPAIAGATGSLKFTTNGFGAGSGYDVFLVMIKGVPQV
jgi:hypothetical protein